jgi:TetR/AcrR family transcriptional regulator, regulator of cefoperazone and chloramphenicol sensitivity
MSPPLPLEPTPQPAAAAAPSEAARSRLLDAGLRLFAAQGYSKTSTRELAEAANVNIASISYYFGDKAGLYRAVFTEPMGGEPADDIARFIDPALPLVQALRAFYASFLEPLKEGERARLCMKLHFREMLEPTGVWQEEISQSIRPMHEALLMLLSRHLRLPAEGAAADADLQRLAICLSGLAVHLHVGTDINEQLAPGLLRGPQSIDLWSERLAEFGHAMVQAEAARRGLRLAATSGARA